MQRLLVAMLLAISVTLTGCYTYETSNEDPFTAEEVIVLEPAEEVKEPEPDVLGPLARAEEMIGAIQDTRIDIINPVTYIPLGTTAMDLFNGVDKLFSGALDSIQLPFRPMPRMPWMDFRDRELNNEVDEENQIGDLVTDATLGNPNDGYFVCFPMLGPVWIEYDATNASSLDYPFEAEAPSLTTGYGDPFGMMWICAEETDGSWCGNPEHNGGDNPVVGAPGIGVEYQPTPGELPGIAAERDWRDFVDTKSLVSNAGIQYGITVGVTMYDDGTYAADYIAVCGDGEPWCTDPWCPRYMPAPLRNPFGPVHSKDQGRGFVNEVVVPLIVAV